MEEIIYSLTEIRKALENDRLDILLAFITGLAPIFLTILNIHLSVKMNKQNEKLHFFS
jgi:hypothetical protein